MIDTFEKWQNARNAQQVILCEIEPSLHLTDWVKTSGRTNVYEQVLPYAIEGSDNKISRVREDDDTWYQRAGSLDICDSVAATYYYDYSANKLYVHTSDAGNPAAKTVLAYFWLYFADESKKAFVIDDASAPVSFLPYLETFGTLSRGLGDMLNPGGDTISVGDIVFDNGKQRSGSGFWDNIYYDYIWYGSRVRLLAGGEAMPYSEYALIGTFTIHDKEKNFDVVKFGLADNRDFLKRYITEAVFDTTTYPNLEKGKEGAYIPVGWGPVFDFVPTCIDTATEKYKPYNHRCIVLACYDNNNGLHVPVGFTADNINGEFTLAASPVGQLTCDLVGLVDANLTSSVSMGVAKNITLEADTWYRLAFYAESDGTAEISAKLQNPDSDYLQDDRTWGAEAWLTDMTIGADITGDPIGVSIPFKSGAAGTYVLLIDEKGSGTGTLGDVIVCKTYELPGALVKDVCENRVSVPELIYDATNLTDFDALRPYPLGIIVDRALEANELFRMIDAAVFSHHRIDRSGVLRFAPWNVPELTDPGIQEYDKYSFVSMKEAGSIDDIRWKINIGYGNWIASNKWNYESAPDTTVKYKYRTSKEETIPTALAYKQDAAAVAALYLAIFGLDNNSVTLRALQKPLASDLGNTISLAIDRFNKNASAALLIKKFDEQWADRETVMTLIS